MDTTSRIKRQPQLQSRAKNQAGSMLLEALFAILIFSMGILALVGLQVTAVKQSTGAQYRADAAMVANTLVGQMWGVNRNPATLNATLQTYATGGVNYANWLPMVQAAVPVTTAPTVVVAADNLVTITVFWKAASEPASEPTHSYVLTAQIN